MGNDRNLIVHSEDGLDEISTTCPTRATSSCQRRRPGEISNRTSVVEVFAGQGFDERYEVTPEQFGMAPARSWRTSPAATQPRTRPCCAPSSTASRAPRLDIVLLNAGAALYIAEAAGSIADGVEKARAAVASGAARDKLDVLVATTRRLAQETA